MTYTISAIKTELAAQLTAAGIQAQDFIPEYVTPPIALIFNGSPYIEATDKQTFRDTKLRLQVRLVSGQSSNEYMTDQIDDLIGLFYVTLRDADSAYGSAWEIESVSQPFGYSPVEGDAPLLAVDVVMTTAIEIKVI